MLNALANLQQIEPGQFAAFVGASGQLHQLSVVYGYVTEY
jgi:hypothetical protein